MIKQRKKGFEVGRGMDIFSFGRGSFVIRLTFPIWSEVPRCPAVGAPGSGSHNWELQFFRSTRTGPSRSGTAPALGTWLLMELYALQFVPT